jgi:hypothetical protein
VAVQRSNWTYECPGRLLRADAPPGLERAGSGSRTHRAVPWSGAGGVQLELPQRTCDEHFIFCGVGCYLLLRDNRSWSTTAAVVTASLSGCVAMAFSRLYLAVHYASDVIGGLLAGFAWVVVCVSAPRRS